VLLNTIAITKNNIEDTVIKDGFLKPSQICTGQYAKPCQQAGIQ
jgi:D-xylose transport system substrate-binding protein